MAHRKTTSPRSRSRPSSGLLSFLILAGAVLVVAGFAAFTSGGGAAVSAVRSGNSVDFTVSGLDGQAVHLADYRGHPVLVNLWASWCPPCREEMPSLIRFYHQHRAEGLVMVAVNSTDTTGPAREFAQLQGMDFPVAFDPEGKVMRMFGTDGLPSSYLIDRNGNIVFSHVGGISADVLASQVALLLSQ